MSQLSYRITYLNGDKKRTIRVNFDEDQISGIRYILAAVPTLSTLYGDTDNVFRSIMTDRELLRIEPDTSDKDILKEATKTSEELSNQNTTLKQIYELFGYPPSGPLNELEFIDAFGTDLSPGVIVTDGAISSEDNVPVDSVIEWSEPTNILLSFNSKDGSNTVLIAPNNFIIDSGKLAEFESGALYILKLLVDVYNLNYNAKMDYPAIYSLQLSKPKQLVGFMKSSDLGVESSTRLQY